MNSKRQKFLRKGVTPTVITAIGATVVTPTVLAENSTFEDVPNDHPYYNQIETLVETGVVQGDGSGSFSPNETMSRAAAAEMIAKALQLESSNENPFKDVPSDHWASDSITALYEADIVQGDENNNFNPSHELTRKSIAEMVVKAYDLNTNTEVDNHFDDVSSDHWYADSVNLLASHNLINGDGEGNFLPHNDLQRQHFSKLVYESDMKHGLLGYDPSKDSYRIFPRSDDQSLKVTASNLSEVLSDSKLKYSLSVEEKEITSGEFDSVGENEVINFNLAFDEELKELEAGRHTATVTINNSERHFQFVTPE